MQLKRKWHLTKWWATCFGNQYKSSKPWLNLCRSCTFKFGCGCRLQFNVLIQMNEFEPWARELLKWNLLIWVFTSANVRLVILRTNQNTIISKRNNREPKSCPFQWRFVQRASVVMNLPPKDEDKTSNQESLKSNGVKEPVFVINDPCGELQYNKSKVQNVSLEYKSSDSSRNLNNCDECYE